MTPKYSFIPALSLSALLVSFSEAKVIFSESFESPVVSGFDENTVPDSGWVGATNGFGSNRRGLFNESVAWPARPRFTTPFGEQGYLLNYTNSALTTAQGTIPGVLTEDVKYIVTFNTAVQSGVASGSYLVELVAFDPADDNVSRRDGQSTRVGMVLASATGAVTTSDLSEEGSVTFTAAAGDASLGKEIGLRLVKAGNNIIYDNVRLITGHDLAPMPADGVTVAGGSLELSWTNRPANVGGDTYVDVWFGTDPVSDFTKIVTGGTNTSSASVTAPVADVYYWRVDSYLEGSPSGTPIESKVFAFQVTDTDGDGFPDSYELANTDPVSNVALNPSDDLENGGAGDGLTNLQEFQFGTDPNNADSDNDNLEDGAEIAGAGARPATNPLNADSDDDGLNDDVESNTGTFVGASDTGTNPTDSDYDKDGLPDGVETKSGTFVGRTTDTGTDPYLADSDADGAGDWYEVAATFTDPNSDAEAPAVPYPLPDPDGSTGVTDKPVKVYIMSGQSNMVGIGYIDGSAPGSMETVLRRDNKFPNMVENGVYTERNDVYYRGVVTAIGDGPLTVGVQGNRVGPELGFGHVMGWYHDEPVLLIKASQGNRSLSWDFLPPGSTQFDLTDGNTYAGYGDRNLKWPTGTVPEPVGWYAGKQYDDCFLDEADWAPAGSAFESITNTADVLANFATHYPQWADQGYEIAGFVWWQGHKDQYETAHHNRYETNLVTLIDSLRTEFDAPDTPFVVATIGFQGGNYDPGTAYDNIYQAQLAVGDPAQHPEFSGTVASVDTTPYWRSLAESPGNQDFHYNNNAETYTLVGDAIGRAMLSLQNDMSPPNQGVMEFSIAPTAVDASTVGMVAITATDPSGPVEYYFENITNANSSGWTTAPSWNDSGLVAGSYSYRVKARDAEGNETAWSAPLNGSPGNDVSAPLPSPLNFTSPPTALGEDSIAMSATPATDINDVEYYFDSLTPGGTDSGWQDSLSYTDTGLNPGTEYSYQVKARDKSAGQNETASSAVASATTTAPDLTPPMLASLSPIDGATEIAVDAVLEATFDEDLSIGSGQVILRNLTENSETVIDITDSAQVSVSGSVLTINPTADFAPAAEMAVQITTGAIRDLVSNNFTGIADDTTWNFTTITPPPAGLLLSEDFESPDIDAAAGSGITNRTVPDNGNWVGSNQGFGSNRRGMTDKAGGDFAASDPNQQAFAFRYSNSGLTSAEGVIGALTAGTTYQVSFDVVQDGGHNSGTPYNAQLIAFGAGAARDDIRSTPSGSSVLATAGGSAPDDGSFERVTFEFTADAGDGNLGKDLGVRFLGATTSAIIDNVRVISTSGGGGGNLFVNWIAGFTGLGSKTAFGDDPDGDGVGNGLENYFGTNPGESSQGLMAELANGNIFTFTHPLSDAQVDDLTAGYQWSSDLETFYLDGSENGGTTVSFSQGVITNGMVTVTATVSGPVPAKLFVNLEVVVTP